MTALNPLTELLMAFYSQYGFVPIRQFIHDETGEPAIRLRYGANRSLAGGAHLGDQTFT
jgi:hypothetical protein